MIVARRLGTNIVVQGYGAGVGVAAVLQAHVVLGYADLFPGGRPDPELPMVLFGDSEGLCLARRGLFLEGLSGERGRVLAGSYAGSSSRVLAWPQEGGPKVLSEKRVRGLGKGKGGRL